VKYDPLKNAVSGEIRPIYGRESGQIAAEGGLIVLQLRYMEADQSAAEGEWDNTKDFENHPAEKTSFQLGLGDHSGLREGRRYSAELRFEIRPGLASEWTPFKFKARARPKIKLPSSPFIMQVGVANQIDCTVEGYPVPSIKWTKKGDNENVLSTNCSLMFPNATADDQGVYCVEAQNLVGCDTQEILVSFPELEKNEEQGRILDLVTKLSIQGDKQNEELEGLTDLVKKLSIRGSHSAVRKRWTTANAKITFEHIIVSVGQGELDAGTGIFKCGQSGTYSMSWSCVNMLDGGEENVIILYRKESGDRNGSLIIDSRTYNRSGNRSIGETGGRALIGSLKSGDQLWLETAEFTGTAYAILFNVQLIAAD